MPNHKHHRGHRQKDEDTNNNNDHAEAGNNNNHGRPARVDNAGPKMWECCIPTACRYPEESIEDNEPGSAVRVVCNNENCQHGRWMHKDCFEEWEQSVLSYLRSCGRARSWSEKQRLQNLWTKKGYDLAFKACDCKCGRGHLRKDLDYIPPTPQVDNARKQKKHKKKNDKPMPVVSTSHKGSHAHNVNTNHSNGSHTNHTQQTNQSNHSTGTVSTNSVSANINIINNNNNGSSGSPSQTIATSPGTRLRTCSMSSTGSSPPTSATSGSPLSSSPVGGSFLVKQNSKKSDFFSDPAQAAAGNIFKKRQDFSAFSIVPRVRQNPYNIKMEDEGPYGNDDVRSFVLSALSSYKLTSIRCVLCKSDLPVFDHYPLIDGTFFLSPQAYDEGVIQVIWEGRIQFLNSLCVNCMEGKTDIKCVSCKRKWNSSTYVLGTMYTYDIFAAMPCCQKRLTCKHCRRAVVDVKSGLNFFSQYSQMIICPYCKANDYHFIRPLSETYVVKQPICY